MSTHASATELRSMQSAELLREIHLLQTSVEKLRLGIRLGKEKDTARYRREKRYLARMQTEVSRKQSESLRGTTKNSKVPASQS